MAITQNSANSPTTGFFGGGKRLGRFGAWLRGFSSHHTDLLVGMALVVCAFVAGFLFMVPTVTGVFHDDGIYVSTAKSLALNEGYHLINLPGNPPQTKYPPVYPVLLSLIWRIWPTFPDNVRVMQLLTLFMSALSVGLGYYYVVTCGYFRRSVAVVAALLLATSHYVLYYSSLVLTEMPFSFFLILALLAVDRLSRSTSNRKMDQVLVALAIVLPFLTRSIGAVLIPIAIIFLFLHRRGSWLIVALPAAVLLGWFAWTARSQGSSPAAYYYTSYWAWWKDLIDLRVLGRVIFFNLVGLSSGVIYSGATFLTKVMSWDPHLWFWIAIPGIPVFVGMWRGARKKALLPWVLIAYLLVVLVWPWPPQRFAIPVLGLLLCFLFDETRRVLGYLRPFAGVRWAAAAVCVVLVVSNVWQAKAVAAFNHRTQYPTTVSSWRNPVEWSSFSEAFGWIRTNTNGTDIVASYFDSMVFLYTGRRAFRPLVVAPASPYYGIESQPVTAEQLFQTLRGGNGRYVLCTPFDRFDDKTSVRGLVEEFGRSHPGAVSTVFIGEDSRFKVYEIRPDSDRKKGHRAGRKKGMKSKNPSGFTRSDSSSRPVVEDLSNFRLLSQTSPCCSESGILTRATEDSMSGNSAEGTILKPGGSIPMDQASYR
jgi:hypothetical protein